MDSPLEAQRLSKRFGRVVALDCLELNVGGGLITALVGPNGAGKSTLMRLLMGFERPSSGHALVHGLDPWHQRAAALRHVAYVPQAGALYADLCADDHFTMVRRYRQDFDIVGARRRLDALAINRRTRAGHLSGGQRAQVLLTIAVATNADVLLLDEPLANLDPLARRDFLHTLADTVRRDGRTALISSHIVTDVEQSSDAVAILAGGRLLLHSAIEDAARSHSVIDGKAAEPGVVSTFRTAAGGLATLVASPAGDRDPAARSATFEEIVIGYLASGRSDEAGDT